MSSEGQRIQEKIVLDSEDLAYLIGVRPEKIKSLVKMNELPHPFMIGNNERWLRKDVDAFLASKSRHGMMKFNPASHTIRIEPSLNTGEFPEELSEAKESLVEYATLERIPCVYFLINMGVVVYVGKTTRLPVRVEQHRAGNKRTPKKEFDRVLYIAIEESQLDNAEMYYIKMLTPVLNRNGNTGWPIK